MGGTTNSRPGQGEGGFAANALAPLAMLALAIFAYLSFSQNLFNDGDTSWHLAAGRLILDTRSVPDADPFSFTFRGHPWVAHEWLAEAVMAAVFRLGAWGALGVLFGFAVSALILILGVELGRHVPVRRMLVVLAAVFMVLAPFVLARPHVLAWPLLAGWTLVLLRAREAGRSPPIPAALLMLLWANLHGSFLFGLVLVGVFGLEALLQEPDRRRTLQGWSAFGFASLALALATPHGIHGLFFPLQVSSMEALPLIMEWRPSSLSEDLPFLLVLAATIAFLLYRRPGISLPRLILLGALLYLSLSHARHQPLLAIVATLLLAEPLSRGSILEASSARPRVVPLLATFLAGAAVVAGIRLSFPTQRTESATSPIAAIETISPALHDLPVLNSYGFGGPLILHGISPFIDGRADMYGDRFLFEHHRIVAGDVAAFRHAALRWGIKWTILSPGEPLVRMLDQAPGWRRVYADEFAVVHARR